ncbi:hypothetical protein ACOSQ2_014320 [Xanthoceras sorbifolium]
MKAYRCKSTIFPSSSTNLSKNSGSATMASSSSSQLNQASGALSSPFNSQINFNLPIKLDRTNYLLWKAQVLLVVRAYNLKEYIFESKLALVKFIETTFVETNEVARRFSDEFLAWKKNDQLLVCWMISTLS